MNGRLASSFLTPRHQNVRSPVLAVGYFETVYGRLLGLDARDRLIAPPRMLRANASGRGLERGSRFTGFAACLGGAEIRADVMVVGLRAEKCCRRFLGRSGRGRGDPASRFGIE